MIKLPRTILILVVAANLAACAVTPATIVQEPTSVKPQKAAPAVAANGAIYQAAAYRPMFEDRRARMVGDILTITISEKTSAAKTAASSASKAGSVSFTTPAILHQAGTASAVSSNKFEDKGAVSSANTFTGTLGVTVVDVLPNGNLLVSGEKQVAFDKGTEYIRFSGVVSPDTIASGNVVSSLQVADARVEYRTNTRVDKAEMASMFSRFFLSLVPL